MSDTPHSSISTDRLLGYLSGEVSAAEARDLESALAAEPSLSELVAQLRAMQPGPFTAETIVDLEKGWSRVEQLLEQGNPRPQLARGEGRGGNTFAAPSSSKRPPRSGWGKTVWYTFAGVAAALFAVVAGIHVERAGMDVAATKPVSVYATGNGERARITLPDGNTVALGVASHLEVPANYLTGDHKLRLSGEAFFTITHREASPISVQAGSTVARVLGTSFTVRHYTTDSVTTVAVQEGKVAVGKTVLTDNRMVEVHPGGTALVRIATPSQFSFATGLLTIDDAYLPAAIPDLDRWYDTDIRLGNPALAKRDIGGTFAAGSIADLATNLELMLNVRVVRDGRVLTLYPR